MPVLKFFFWTWLGETIKMLAFAYVGCYLKVHYSLEYRKIL